MRAETCGLLFLLREEDIHGFRPALMSTYVGKPGRQVWLSHFGQVRRVVVNATDPGLS
jgi:hypothetical protein